jgi:uncharacterized protein (TIGR02271 family)
MTYEKVVTVYDTLPHAEKAVTILKAAGYNDSDISVVNQRTLEAHGADEVEIREPGLWRRLFGSTVLDHEATVYGRTVENGGVVVTVRVASSDVPRVMGLLDTHNPVDVLKRAATVGAIPATLVAKAAAAGAGVASAVGAAASTAPVSATAKAVAATASPSASDVIRLAEEQLNVGKRLVQDGSTRIRRFVTEKPVEASVTLHEEHAQVLRRAITDPGYIADVDWSDRTIEVTESAEQAVVSKNSRVVEEVVVRKEGTDRVETIKDKVRRQELEVERLDRDGKKKSD